MDMAALRASAPSSVRFVERFVADAEVAALFRRADLVVLPYREIDQSGVLFTAWPSAGRSCSATSAGSPRSPRPGAARLVPPGDRSRCVPRCRRAARRSRRARAPRRGVGARRRRALRLGRHRAAPPRAVRETRTMTEHDDWVATNRAMWDERVPIHVGSDFYDVEGFLAGATTLRPFELEELGGVDGAHARAPPSATSGLDTLSWACRGARVTDWTSPGRPWRPPATSPRAAGLDADFVQANVYDAVQALGGRRFDIVYTGLGAINWLPDIERWARVMAELLAPGGTFYLAEFHPFSWVFGRRRPHRRRLLLLRRAAAVRRSSRDLRRPRRGHAAQPQRRVNHGLGEDGPRRSSPPGCGSSSCNEHDYTLFPAGPTCRSSERQRLPAARRRAVAAAHVLLRAKPTRPIPRPLNR